VTEAVAESEAMTETEAGSESEAESEAGSESGSARRRPDVEQAPEGASCAAHPQRQALFTCPRCGTFVCALCFHPSVDRCQRCVQLDPNEAADPVPWEQGDVPVVSRYLRTLGSAFSPMRTAPSLARDDVQPALHFFLLSALPFAMLGGIIPHTRTLLFGGRFDVQVIGQPSVGEVALDVARAMGIQLVLGAIQLACLALPYVSLIRGYAPEPERRFAAVRVMLYRFWLLPGTLLFVYLGLWAVADPGAQTAGPGVWLLQLVQLVAPIFLLVAMGGVARMACGLGPLMSMLVVLVPMLLLLVVEPLTLMGLEQILPPPPTTVSP
jgi:hypothetical protein